MNVRELIDELSTMPMDAPVILVVVDDDHKMSDGAYTEIGGELCVRRDIIDNSDDAMGYVVISNMDQL